MVEQYFALQVMRLQTVCRDDEMLTPIEVFSKASKLFSIQDDYSGQATGRQLNMMIGRLIRFKSIIIDIGNFRRRTTGTFFSLWFSLITCNKLKGILKMNGREGSEWQT